MHERPSSLFIIIRINIPVLGNLLLCVSYFSDNTKVLSQNMGFDRNLQSNIDQLNQVSVLLKKTVTKSHLSIK
ncbi:hypothetical protein A3224_04545 [Microbulbifer thermotolerans]|uniref:Uncharacterized protein n=1 Tax=Microbulbifer thermotolerans TaxID=252514 RepID=A0A143HKC4_MICTH|nr:hypothetical protein A3224_04545 [Microbulbifer thermotolerans]